MGKKYKKSKKVLWRRLSLNETSTKESENGLVEEEETTLEEEEGNTCTSPPPQSQSRSQEAPPPQRKPFHPNFVPGDQRRFPPPFVCGPRRGFERGISVERFSHPRFFRGGRPFFSDPRQGPQFPGPSFQGGRKRPLKFYDRGGFFVRGQSPYGGEGGLRRRWSQDEDLCFVQRNEGDEGEERVERLTQPVHTVLINDAEQYTKIQTPRQEVIFKKSCWDRKCDPTEVDYDDPSLAGSSSRLEHGSRDSQGDQGSVTGSSEESNMSPSMHSMDERQQHEINHRIHNRYDDSASVFVGDPNAPPLAGVVMQQTYPGGPMISIPVQWTPFLDPGLIPGDTALTTLDPAFTHVIDTKSLTVDPAHILPVQHDSNGCPVTVQVKVDADGVPIEIEPTAFTVSLSTLEQRQQDVLFRRSNDYANYGQMQVSSGYQICHPQENYFDVNEDVILQGEENSQKTDAELGQNELGADIHEDCTHDSQYASMSEPSTAPTTPSGELCDHCDSNSVDSNFESDMNSKSPNNDSILQSPKESRRVSCADSLQDSETMENEDDEPCSCCDPFGNSPNSAKHFDPSCNDFSTRKLSSSLKNDSDSSRHNDDAIMSNLNDSAHFTMDSLSQCSTCESQTSESHNAASISSCCQNILSSVDSCCHTLTSDSDVQAAENSNLSSLLSKGSEVKKKEKKARKLRSSSIESDYSCQSSSATVKLNEKNDTTSKYQAKREAKKIKKEKKKSSKDKNKIKLSVTKDLSKSFEGTEKVNDYKESISDTRLGLVQSEKECSAETVDLKASETLSTEPDILIKNFDSNKSCEAIIEVVLCSSPVTSSESEKIYKEKLHEPENLSSFDISDKDIVPEAVNGDQDTEAQIDNDSRVPQGDTTDDTVTHDAEKEDDASDAGFTCKPGFIMVPILTPYYDPAVLYGYPLVLADNMVDRGYMKKKKKKFRRKHQDHQLSLPLDAELYVGETFVATPNGYMVPVDSSHMCQIHGYQYNHNFYPQAVNNDGFASLQHSPYVPEVVSESAYHKGYYYQDQCYQPSFSRLHEVERMEIKEVLEQHPKEDPTKTLPVDSADSGVSESEEPNIVLEKGLNLNDNGTDNKDELSTIADGVKEKSLDDLQTKISTKKRVRKENAKKKLNVTRTKTKKPIMEIEEPDFSSFSGSVLRFEVKRENSSGSCSKIEPQRNNKQAEVNDVKDVKLKSKKTKNKKGKEKLIPLTIETAVIKQSSTCSSSAPKTLKALVDGESHKNTLSTHDKLCNDKTSVSNSTPQLKELHASPKLLGEEIEVKKKRNRKKKEKNKENKVNNEVCTVKNLDDFVLPENSEGMCLPPNSEIVLEQCTQDIMLPQNGSNLILENEECNINFSHDSSDVMPSCAIKLIPTCDIGTPSKESQFDTCLSENITEHPKDIQINALASETHEEIDAHVSSTLSSCNSVMAVEPSIDNTATISNEDTATVSNEDTATVSNENTAPEICAPSVGEDNCDSYEKHDAVLCPVPLVSHEPIIEEIIMVSEENVDDISEECCDISSNNDSAPLIASSLKDLGVTEAVMKWMSEVSPEKVFSLSDERRSMLLTELFLSSENFEEDSSDDEVHIKASDSKNGESNPLVAKSSKKALGRCSERVAFSSLNQKTPSLKRIRSLSRDTIDEYDGESIVSNLSRERLYSSSSSSSYLAATPTEEPSTINDPRVYDPAVYSKYYQLGVDVRITPSNSTANSSRESTLAPSLSEEAESEDVFHLNSLSIDVENCQIERVTSDNIMPTLCDDHSVPHFDCSTSTLPEGSGKIRDSLSSASSSGIGSSLASTPVVSPAHEPIYPIYAPLGEHQLNPIQSLKREEVPMSSRAVCSIM